MVMPDYSNTAAAAKCRSKQYNMETTNCLYIIGFFLKEVESHSILKYYFLLSLKKTLMLHLDMEHLAMIKTCTGIRL